MCVQFVHNNFWGFEMREQKCLEKVCTRTNTFALNFWFGSELCKNHFVRMCAYTSVVVVAVSTHLMGWRGKHNNNNDQEKNSLGERIHSVGANKWNSRTAWSELTVRSMLMLLNFCECFMRILIAWTQRLNAKCFIVSARIIFGCFAACTNSHSFTLPQSLRVLNLVFFGYSFVSFHPQSAFSVLLSHSVFQFDESCIFTWVEKLFFWSFFLFLSWFGT